MAQQDSAAHGAPPRRGSTAVRRWTRRLTAAALVTLGAALAGEPALAACQPANYCSAGGPCVSISQVRQAARQAFGAPWRVSRIRLVGQAPTASCLWYEVRLQGPGGQARIAYWDVNGRRAR
ncbi:MAG: hypothetical protein AAF909_09220 [Pseudomonadota bacterium]